MKKISRSLNLTVVLAMLTAISIICGKYLAIRGGDIMRFSLENMPILFAGIAFGPIAGAFVGLVADLVGCIMVGYTINPLVALGSCLIGLVSGGMTILLKRFKLDERLSISITVFSSHIIGSLIFKTLGLAVYYTPPFHVLLLWRLLNYIIVGLLDATVIYLLINNKEIKKQIERLNGKQ